ncbi:inositol monophosphatase family protein [Gulosibacter sp. ACHW.36C]|uniref:Inositol-1-monophosphatase n=1 Tax=Gulosibacter sediminis TaxID=1729695 RepID=A0ABY4MX11_9MICO|nr:inositol monophosphatase family protein [Gulosibacter sediminis]UQN14584.1 inositol monophosphatase [Gulosibacter sediminis]
MTNSSIHDQLPELLRIASELGAEAGELIATRRREGISVAATKSSSVDVVTEADRECEAFLRARLAELRPDDGFFGEESDATATRSGITWVVDPIDGTVNYLYGLPSYAVSIAAVTGDPSIQPTEFEILVGAVVSPELGATYTAVAGGGAWRNGEPLQLGAGPEDLARTLVATGFSYTAARRELQAQALLNVIGKVRDLRRIGAASLDLCAVATGQIDAYYEFGLSQWDWAAGALIAKEAGASVSGLDLEQREGRSSLVAGHPRIAAQLVDLLSEVTPQDLL